MAPRTLLLTGASSGIGRALSLEYARRGTRLAIVARRREALEALADEVRALGSSALVLVADVADTGAAGEAVRQAERELGGLDLVIANAGVGTNRHSSRIDWDHVARVFAVNVGGAVATLLAAVPAMLSRGTGQLVGVSSLAGRRGMPAAAAYSASKAALAVFLEALRIDLGPKGVRVTDVQPGFVESEMTAANRFPMPFMWSSERAARHIANRLERAPAMIAFPWQLDLLTGLSRLLPPGTYDALMRASRGKN